MEAVVYKGGCKLLVESVEDAGLDQPTEAFMQIILKPNGDLASDGAS